MSLWLRELGHVGVWFILAEGCQYFALLWFPELVGVFAILFVALLLLIATLLAEWKEYRSMVQGPRKTAWDIAAKCAGILLAVRFPAMWEAL